MIAEADGLNITPDAISKVAYLADGSMRDSLSILEQCMPLGDITLEGVEQIVGIAGDGALLSIAESIRTGNISAVMTMVDKLLAEGKEVLRLMESILDVMRDLLVCKSGDALDITGERLKQYEKACKAFTAEELMYCIRIFTDAITTARLSSKPKILLETSLLRCCKPELSIENDALLARIAKLEQNGVTVNVAPVIKEAVVEDDIPFPTDSDIPMPTDADLPPWDDAEPVPVAEEKMEEVQPVVEEAKPVQEEPAQEAEPEPVQSGASADQLLDKIKSELPSVGPSLLGAKAKLSDGVLVICQTKSFTFGMLQRSTEMLKKAAGTDVKVVNSEAEFNSFAETAVPQTEDKFAELLAQKELFGDKMIIE